VDTVVRARKQLRVATLEMLKWLRTNGCPWCEDTFVIAVKARFDGYPDLDIIEWLRCPGHRPRKCGRR
jgi:hypothetical protein